MDTPPSLLILGYRKALLEACYRLKIKATTIINASQQDSNLPPCGAGEQRIFVEKLSNLDDVLCALARAGQLEFDAAYTINEHGVILASLLGLAIAQPWMSPKVAVAFRDKYHQKNLLRGAVPVADAWPIEDTHTFVIEQDYPYPLIIKPIAGAGTFYTEQVGSREELEEVLVRCRASREIPRTMVLERYMTGEEWHMDGWISAGQLRHITVSQYRFPLIGIKDGGIVQSVTLRPEEHEAVYQQAREFVSTVLARLNLRDGVFHMEIFYNPDTGTFTFSECGARIGGGLIPQAFAAMFGIDLHEVAVRIALGEQVDLPVQRNTLCAGWTFLPAAAGQVVTFPPMEQLSALPGILHIEYDVEPGEVMPDMTEGTSLRAGTALVGGATEQEVRERINTLIAHFQNATSSV